MGRRVQRRQAGRPLLQGRMEAVLGRGRLRHVAAPTASPGSAHGRQAADEMGGADEKPGPAFYGSLLRQPVRRRADARLRARRDRRRAARPGRRARHPERQPLGPRLREPRLERRVAPVARPRAAARPHAPGLLPRPRRDGRQGQLHRGADGRPRLHAGARAQPGAGPRRRPAQRQPDAGAPQRRAREALRDAEAGAVRLGLRRSCSTRSSSRRRA